MRRKRRKGEMVGVGSALSRVLSELGLDGVQRAFDIGAKWEEAVGPEVARHARPVAMRGDVLEVRVESSVWAQQLQLRSPEIVEALARVLEGEAAAPRELHFRVGKVGS